MAAASQVYTTRQVAAALGWTPDEVRHGAEQGEIPCVIDHTGQRRRFQFRAEPWDHILASLRAGFSWEEVAAHHGSSGIWGFSGAGTAPDLATDGEALALQLAMANGRIADLEHDLADSRARRAELEARSEELSVQVTRLRSALKALVE